MRFRSITLFTCMGRFHDPGTCQFCFVRPLNKARIFFYYPYIRVGTWKFRWSYTPCNIHMTYYSSWHYSQGLLFHPVLFTKDTIDSSTIITLFRSITMFCGTDNIMWNILSFKLNVMNILQNTASPGEHCYEFD